MSTVPIAISSKEKSWISEINLPFVLGVFVLPAIGAALRFHQIRLKPLWFDEGMSLGCAELSWHDSLSLAIREPVQWPFYLAMKFSLLFGNSETFVRLPSTLFMIAAIPLLFIAARRLVGEIAALIATALFVFSAEMVKYAQEARSYGLEVFLLILSLYLLTNLVERPTRRNQLAYVLICALAVYAHMYSALVIAAQGLSLFALPANNFRPLRWLQTYASIVLITIPMWIFVARIPARETYYMTPLSPQYAYYVFQHLFGNAGPLLVLVYSILFAASVIALIFILRSQGRSHESWVRLLPVMWTGLPILMTVTATYLGKPSFGERYLVMCVPGLVLLTGSLVASLRRAALILPIVLVLSVAGYAGVRNYYHVDYERIPENYPELANFIANNSAAEDAIVFYWSRMEIPYRYYMNRFPSRVPRPESIYPAPRSVDPLRIIAVEGPPQLGTAGYPRVWLVVHRMATMRSDPAIDQITATLDHEFSLEQVTNFNTFTVMLYVRNSTP
ncbi:MAG TPA: glycosyltransferase family 39 protein [Terriglobales bacterium]|jgi:mannosyltransferase|nr:glycosyltransferase family 39 protein [Terriglobales bacterium]